MKQLFYIAILLVMLNYGIVLADDGYAVVVSKKTQADAQWNKVVETLKIKHNGSVIVWDQSVDESLDKLTEQFPRYACFVAQPDEAGRQFVASVHQLTRRLDGDPYADVIWGIITGYDAADALRIAEYNKPLTVKRVLTGTVGSPLDEYDEGLMFNELKANEMWEKTAGGDITLKSCPTDTTKLIVDAMNDYKPDVFITSGHATERDWMIGYTFRAGFFKCKDGLLYGEDAAKKRYEINSPNPKVHLAVGNCLIAHIPDKNCMALALMRSAGVYQMVGYTVPSGYGYGGWGVKDYFSELQAGRFTLAEAHYANQLALIYELEKRNMNSQGDARGGLRGDRDVVVLYGDPAWQAKMKPRKLLWSQKLSEDKGVFTFTITANDSGDWDNRPVVQLLDKRVKNVEIIEGQKFEPVIMDNFILVPVHKALMPMKGNRGGTIPIEGDFKKGDIIRIVFKATT